MPYGLVRCWRWPLVVSHEYGADLDQIIKHLWADTREVNKCFARVWCVQQWCSLWRQYDRGECGTMLDGTTSASEMSHGDWDLESSGGGGCKSVGVGIVRSGKEERKAPRVWWCIKDIPRGSIPPRKWTNNEYIEAPSVGRCNSWVF